MLDILKAAGRDTNLSPVTLLGLAVSDFMKDNGLKTAYVRQQCQIGSFYPNSFVYLKNSSYLCRRIWKECITKWI